jgi:uncharacterized phiE125 gp8 family phage protein
MFCNGTEWLDYYPSQTTRVKDQEIRSTVRVVTPPTSEPVTIAEAKAQLSIGASDVSHDTEVASLIAAAREEWERDTSIALITRTLEHRLPKFLSTVVLSVRPAIAISSVTYVDTAGATQTVASSNYYLDGDEVRFLDTFVRPSVQDRSEAVKITYTAGYGSDSRACPELDRMAIKLSLANRFEDRDMIAASGERRAYEALVAKKMRASYP